jgi:hypothetical protein
MYHDFGENFWLPGGAEPELDKSGDRWVVRLQFHELQTGWAVIAALRNQLDTMEKGLLRMEEELKLGTLRTAKEPSP